MDTRSRVVTEAVKKGGSEVEELLATSASPDEVDETGQTAVHWMVKTSTCSTLLLETMLRHDARIDERCHRGMTPFLGNPNRPPAAPQHS